MLVWGEAERAIAATLALHSLSARADGLVDVRSDLVDPDDERRWWSGAGRSDRSACGGLFFGKGGEPVGSGGADPGGSGLR